MQLRVIYQTSQVRHSDDYNCFSFKKMEDIFQKKRIIVTGAGKGNLKITFIKSRQRPRL